MTADGEATTLLDLFSSPILTEHPENALYLGELPSLPLPELLATPTSLSTQSHTLTASLNALAHTSCPTILSLHNTSSALLNSLSSLDDSLNTLLDTALPALDDVARTFREKSGPTVIEERQRTLVVLEQYDKLRDLLDVPVLMDTCVRNGFYAEALALAGHATTALSALSTIRSQDGEPSEFDGHSTTTPLPLVGALQAEIASSLHAMRLLLLGTLHEPGRKLPAFWKAVQSLRRMQVMLESELALAFVSARIGCLQNALQAVERDAGVSVTTFSDDGDNITGINTADREREMDRRAEDVAKFLKKYIDVWREGAYDLVTQYTTIFLERSSSHGSASSSHLSATIPLPDPVIKLTLPSTLLSLLLPIIKTYLRRAYPHLAPLATQLAYCSSAMARIGMDFRSLLSSLITRAVIDGFARDIKTGAEREWSSTLARHAAKPTPPTKWLVSATQPLPALSTISVRPSSAAHAPPQLLTAFTPLAVR
ncbi:Dor1-like family-domain-containing protein [Lanmaoa asiatica]|nr:Dor1-like family-domain-containing protein [Lanmaoa asiatica]